MSFIKGGFLLVREEGNMLKECHAVSSETFLSDPKGHTSFALSSLVEMAKRYSAQDGKSYIVLKVIGIVDTKTEPPKPPEPVKVTTFTEVK